MKIAEMDVETCQRTMDKIRGRLAEIEGKGLLLSDEQGEYANCPPGGATFTISWCIGPQSTTWYPTTEAALAALAQFAEQEGRALEPGSWHLDLTRPGCHTSSAFVTRHEAGGK